MVPNLLIIFKIQKSDSKNLEIINYELIKFLNSDKNIIQNRETINEKYSTKNIANSFEKIYKLEF